MLHFPTVPRGDITLIVGNELLWSACYVGLNSLALINLRILWFFLMLKGHVGNQVCSALLSFVIFVCLSVCQCFVKVTFLVSFHVD